ARFAAVGSKWCGSILLPSTIEVTSTSTSCAESATAWAMSPQIDVEVTIFRVSESLPLSDPPPDASSEDADEQAEAKARPPMLSAAKTTRRPLRVREELCEVCLCMSSIIALLKTIVN